MLVSNWLAHHKPTRWCGRPPLASNLPGPWPPSGWRTNVRWQGPPPRWQGDIMTMMTDAKSRLHHHQSSLAKPTHHQIHHSSTLGLSNKTALCIAVLIHLFNSFCVCSVSRTATHSFKNWLIPMLFYLCTVNLYWFCPQDLCFQSSSLLRPPRTLCNTLSVC